MGVGGGGRKSWMILSRKAAETPEVASNRTSVLFSLYHHLDNAATKRAWKVEGWGERDRDRQRLRQRETQKDRDRHTHTH